jgi:hypothetical protein
MSTGNHFLYKENSSEKVGYIFNNSYIVVHFLFSSSSTAVYKQLAAIIR